MPNRAFTAELARLGPDQKAGRPPTPAEARAYCRRLARSHYENFTVVSWLLPRALRQHFYNVYAYCRWADDLADEAAGPTESLALLDWWERQLHDCYRGHSVHPVFVALRTTIKEFSIPQEPFLALLSAFRQDQRVTRYETFDELLDYCRRSANPVGRLVLYLGRCHDEENGRLTDKVCTGLQLANFWQDVARDFERGRIYLPQESCRAFGYEMADFERRTCTQAFRRLLASEVERAEALLNAGWPLVSRVPRELQMDVALFIRGGLAILTAIRRQDFDVWSRRPVVGKFEKIRLLASELSRGWLGQSDAMPQVHSTGASLRSSPSHPSSVPIPALDESYEVCQRLARRAASNFYFSFALLPRDKRRAMYALYAFMRRTDDLGDQPRPFDERRAALSQWRRALSDALAGRFDDPILPAVTDTVRRYAIAPETLSAVLDGVEMDLTGRRYETFDELAVYCHRVASVVGEACVQIWGFHDPRALELARQCGLAFQLTNILRDLKEDAEQGRIYLPQEDLRRFDYAFHDLQQGVADERFVRVMRFEIDRARRYYDQAAPLSVYLEPDGRRVFAAMFTAYRGLLEQIERRPAEVLVRRVRLSRLQKLRIATGAILSPKLVTRRG